MRDQDDESSDTESISRSAFVTALLNERPRWRHLFAFTTRQHLSYLGAACVSSAAAAALRTTLSIVLGKVFDIVAEVGSGQLANAQALALVSQYCVTLAAMGAAQWIINSSFLALWLRFGEIQAKSIRHALFPGLMKMRRAWIDSLPHGTTGLVASIQRTTHEVQMATSQAFGYLVADILTAFASLAIAFWASWKLTLVLLATLPPSLILLALTGRKIQPAITKQASHLDSASRVLAASVSGIDLVKLCNGYAYEVRKYTTHTRHAAKQYRIQTFQNCIQIGYTTFWAVAMFAVGFWYGLALVQQGIPPGNILTTFYAVLITLQGVESLLPNWLVFQRGMSAGQVLLALQVEVAEATKEDADTVRPSYFVGAVDIKEVNFSYPTAPSIKCLDNCSLSISAQELTFLVGRSGSGKSTIASLISRTYEAPGDGIHIDGISIKKLQQEWLQQRIMLLEQTPVIFNDTLFRNIAFGHTDPASATQRDVLRACRKFGLESTIVNLSGGLHTVIGGKGCPLSGGQRQRVALARAYLRDPPVLLMDEPTSALDPCSQKLIMNEIRGWRRHKTTVIISHDLDSICEDDFVYVLDKGAVMKSGFKRHLEVTSLGAFFDEALNEVMNSGASPMQTDAMLPARRAPKRPDSRSFRYSTIHGQTWFLNSPISPEFGAASPHATSLLSPRLSVLSGPARSVTMYQPPDMARLSYLLKKPLPPSPELSAPDLSIANTGPPPLEPGLDSISMCTANEPSKPSTARRRRRVVNLGVLTRSRTRASKLSFLSIMRTLLTALDAQHTAHLALGIITTMLGALTTPAFAIVLAKLLAVMWSAGNRAAEGRLWALCLFIVAVIDGICTGLGRYLLESSAQAWVDSVRRSALECVLRQPKSWFSDDKNSQARVAEAFNVHAEEMRNLVGRFLPNIVAVTTMVAASVAWALIIRWDLTLVALAPLPVVVLVLKTYTRLGREWEVRCADAAEETGQIVAEVLAFGRTIAHCSLEGHFSSSFAQAIARCFHLGNRRAWRTCPLFGLYQAFSYVLTALVFYYGTKLLTSHSRTAASVDSVLQVLNLLLFSFGTATELLSTMPQITVTTAAAARVLSYTKLPRGELPPETGDYSHGGRAALLPIRMRDLSFTFPNHPDRATLAGVTLDIQPGQCTVLVSTSGGGKSTLLALLLGLHRPDANATESALTYADIPFAAMDLRHLRAAVGYVPQAPFLFPGSIADNIAYGLDAQSPLRHRSNVRAAARDAGIDDFVLSLPDGYDTLVGDGAGATRLSGGQAQRVTIARALARRPSLLVMDEPTSALDEESSVAVRACVVELVARWRAERRPAAVVVATHSISMMRVADVLVIMEEGRVVEKGAFEDLWFSGDAFRRLVRQSQDAS